VWHVSGVGLWTLRGYVAGAPLLAPPDDERAEKERKDHQRHGDANGDFGSWRYGTGAGAGEVGAGGGKETQL